MRNIPDRDRDRDVGRLGGIATAVRPADRMAATVGRGITAGLVAGAVFGLSMVAAAALTGPSWAAPVRGAASILVGQEALSPAYPLPVALLEGLIAHAAVSALWGVAFAFIAAALGLGSEALPVVGALFGALVWLVDLYVLAPLAWPWLAGAEPLALFMAHTFLYGLPLGLVLASARKRGEMGG